LIPNSRPGPPFSALHIANRIKKSSPLQLFLSAAFVIMVNSLIHRPSSIVSRPSWHSTSTAPLQQLSGYGHAAKASAAINTAQKIFIFSSTLHFAL
jgi:hypothetical protein